MSLDPKSKIKYPGIYRAKVLDNDDSDQLGRIKVEVYPMFNGLEAAVLPWATPASGLFEGAGSGIGAFVVPKVNAFVFVFFEAGDVYQPVYFAEAQTANRGLPSERTTNYPDRKVWKTEKGFVFIVDESNGRVIMKVPENYNVEIKGNCNVNIEGNCNVNIEGDCSLNVNGDCDSEASGNVTIKGATVNINP